MQEADAKLDLPGTPIAPKSRLCLATWIASITIILVSMGNWRKFVYPCYASAIIFQCGVLALFLAWTWQQREKPFARSWPKILLISYAVFSIASCLWAPKMRSSAIGAIPILFSITWAILLATMLRQRDSLRVLARAIFFSGTLAAALGIYHVVHTLKLEAIQKVMGHRNFLAIFLLPPILLGISHLAQFLKPQRNPNDAPSNTHGVLDLAPAFVIISLVIMIGALFLCTSVGAILGLAAGVLCLFGMKFSPRKRLLTVLAIAFAALAAFALLSLPRVTQWLLENHPSQATRLYLWRGCMKMIFQHPVLGWGSGMFMPFFSDFKPVAPMRYGLLTDMTLHPHNELLLVTVEGGVIALALYIGGLFTTMRHHVATVDAEMDISRRALPWALFAGFVAMTVQSFVSVALRFWAPSTLYWTLAGILLAFPSMKETSASDTTPKRPLFLLRFALAIIVAVIIVWGVVWSGARAEALTITRVNGQRLSHREYNKRSAEAVILSRYLPDRIIAMRRRVLTLAKLGDVDGAIALCETLENEAPGLGTTRVVLGELYLQRARKVGEETGGGIEDLQRAADILNRTIKQNPFNANAHVKFATVAMLLSPRNVPVALDHTKQALQVDPENALAHLTMGMLLGQTGNIKGALDAFDRAEALCNENNTAFLNRIRTTRTRFLESTSSPTTHGEPTTKQ